MRLENGVKTHRFSYNNFNKYVMSDNIVYMNDKPSQRNCPTCNQIIVHKNKRAMQGAARRKFKCKNCGYKLKKEYDRKGSKYYKLRLFGQTDPTSKYYVYLLIHPITQKIFYVGKGCGRRMFQHVKDVRSGKITNGINGKLFRYIKGLTDDGQSPVNEVAIENVSEIDALALEAAFIEFYGLDNLCNYQSSGFGCTNHTDEMKALIREKTMKAMASMSPEDKKKQQTAWLLNYVNRYDDNDFRKTFDRLRKKQLEPDLQLLKRVIGGIRRSLTPKEPSNLDNKIARQAKREAMYKARGITVCDKVNKVFKRECPNCKKELSYALYDSLMTTARKGAECLECMGKKSSVWMSNRHQAFTQTQRKEFSAKAKERWNSYSKEKQDRIKQSGRDSMAFSKFYATK